MLHPVGIRQFHDAVPFPVSYSEESGFYYFLAQASLRKLLMEGLDIVGYARKYLQKFEWNKQC
jgi:hypothetical protein